MTRVKESYHIYPKYWNTFFFLTILVLKFVLPADTPKKLLDELQIVLWHLIWVLTVCNFWPIRISTYVAGVEYYTIIDN